MSEVKNKKVTPLMGQYFAIREQYKDALLFFQVGDFYEMFFEDAQKAAAFLGIALTKRGNMNGEPIPLCGVPLHALDHYLTKLVKGGFKVAICDQLEEPKPGKVVKRGVTQVLTPGTLTDSKLLDEKSASYLFSFFPTQDRWGLLFAELLTAQLFATLLPTENEKLLESEMVRFFPDEILLPQNKLGKAFQSMFKKLGYFTTLDYVDLDDQEYTKQVDHWISKQFNKNTVTTLHDNNSLRYAFYHFYNYVNKNQQGALEHFKSLHFYSPDDFLMLDVSTQKNLELFKNNQDASRRHTLFSLMDKAATSMGSRMVKKWISRPLVKKEAIEQRFDVVQKLVDDIPLHQKIRELLVQIGDFERIVGRIALKRGAFADYIAFTRALEVIPELKNLLCEHEHIVLLKIIVSYVKDFDNIYKLLLASLNDDPSKDWLIKAGFDHTLDELRDLVFHSNKKILELEQKERAATGISSLKIRYNKVHGYYIEVTKPNLHLVPDYYIRQQTLVNRERFISRELQDLQGQIVSATSKIDQVEKDIFETIKHDVYQHIVDLRKLAHALAHLDALFSLANVAYDYGYVRPQFNETGQILIEQGRHPVVEAAEQMHFIPNDIVLDDTQSFLIVTGPNMGGKSTFLRQVAIKCIMAHCGSFIPAKSANIALIDRIFTRIGSGDNLAGGKSTFLVEMEETALICKQATKNSLVILDEVGRGTSTFDGFAIAQAVVEHIHTKIGAKCLFATHYHELTALKDRFPAIESYYAASKKGPNGIIFLYKIVRGVADGSFGIEVAKLAELPGSLVCRAHDVLQSIKSKNTGLEEQMGYKGAAETGNLRAKIDNLQRKLEIKEQSLKDLENVDYNDLSPKMAFDLLWKIKENLSK
ncbi:DNA mismatch repair protein MutS [Candidatus Dependentiae bacterium]